MLAIVSGEYHPVRARHAMVLTGWAFLPPIPQQPKNITGQHHIAILAPFGLHDADDLLPTIDIANLQPNNFTGADWTCRGFVPLL